MSGIEGVAKTWLADPPWQKVFKHTVDVLQDYVSYILVKNDHTACFLCLHMQFLPWTFLVL